MYLSISSIYPSISLNPGISLYPSISPYLTPSEKSVARSSTSSPASFRFTFTQFLNVFACIQGHYKEKYWRIFCTVFWGAKVNIKGRLSIFYTELEGRDCRYGWIDFACFDLPPLDNWSVIKYPRRYPCLYLYPLLLPAPDVHGLGGVPLGWPGGEAGPVSLRHPPVVRHGHSGGGQGHLHTHMTGAATRSGSDRRSVRC